MPELNAGFVILSNTSDGGTMSALRRVIVEYLARDAQPQPRVEVRGDIPANAEGVYVSAAHEMPLRQWLFEVLDQRKIAIDVDGLRVDVRGPFGSSQQTFRPAASGGFVTDDLPIATAALVDLDGETFWSDGEVYRRVSPWYANAMTVALVGGLAASALAVVLGLISGGMSVFGKGPSGLGGWIRLSLFLGGVGFLSVSGLFVAYGLLGDFNALDKLGHPSFVSVAMAALSLLAVLGGCLAVVLTGLKTLKSPTAFLVYAWPTSLLMGSLGFVWLTRGWFPLVTWSWA